nr:hypothetical protein [Mycoplasmatales bacterium]
FYDKIKEVTNTKGYFEYQQQKQLLIDNLEYQKLLIKTEKKINVQKNKILITRLEKNLRLLEKGVNEDVKYILDAYSNLVK